MLYVNLYHSNSGGAVNVALRFLEAAKGGDLKCLLFIRRGSHYVKWAIQHGLVYKEFDNSLLGLLNLYSLGILGRLRGPLLNFGDIPFIWPHGKNYYYFDWPYLLTDDAEVWSRMSFRERFYRNIKRVLIKIFIRWSDVIFVQTQEIKNRLAANFSEFTYEVAPNTTAVVPLLAQKIVGLEFTIGCLTRYYTHKNIEILVDVMAELKNKGLSIKLLLTLDIEDHVNVRKLLDVIKLRGLQDVINNVGAIPNSDILNFYNRCDAIILPSLIETFSGIYVESMVLGKPLLLSDRWFSRDICLDYANYFDPLDIESIVHSIVTLKSEVNTEEHLNKIHQGREFALENFCRSDLSLYSQVNLNLPKERTIA